MEKSTVICLSGGLDSSTLLYDLRAQGHALEALTFNYGQRHNREIDAAHTIAEAAGVRCTTVEVSSLGRLLANSALTNSRIQVPHGHYNDESMKTTVVPNRNMIFLAIAAGHALSIGAARVVFGAHAGDHAIYADCRPQFVEAMRSAISEADYRKVELIAPYLTLTKTDICRRGAELKVPFSLTWSCYEGGNIHCGSCGTCVERKEAFRVSHIADPTEYAVL